MTACVVYNAPLVFVVYNIQNFYKFYFFLSFLFTTQNTLPLEINSNLTVVCNKKRENAICSTTTI